MVSQLLHMFNRFALFKFRDNISLLIQEMLLSQTLMIFVLKLLFGNLLTDFRKFWDDT